MASRRIRIKEIEQLHNDIEEANKNGVVEKSIVTQNHFVEALRKINRSISDTELACYKTWTEEYAF